MEPFPAPRPPPRPNNSLHFVGVKAWKQGINRLVLLPSFYFHLPLRMYPHTFSHLFYFDLAFLGIEKYLARSESLKTSMGILYEPKSLNHEREGK